LPGSERDETRPPECDDVAAAVLTAAALDGVHRDRFHESTRLSELVQRIRDRVRRTIPDVELLGDADNRLPYLVTFSCLYVDGERLAMELDRLGFAVGSGSACASRTGLPSHVLTAIGSLTHGNVRISLPIGCPSEAVENFLTVLPEAVTRVRAEAGAP
jgi:cysteine desulfurase